MSYKAKIAEEFAKRKTQEGVDALSAYHLDRLDRHASIAKDALLAAGFSIIDYEFLKEVGVLPQNMPDVLGWDKIGHVTSTLLVGRVAGPAYQKFREWLDKPKDAAAKVESRRKHFFERSVTENSMMIGQAFTWEYLELAWQPFFGTVFDPSDIFAGTLGQVVNTAINIHYLGKMTTLYNATMKRKEELQESGELSPRPIPKPIMVPPITKPSLFIRQADKYFIESAGCT